MKSFKVKTFKVKVMLKPVVKITGLSALQPVEVNELIDNLKCEFCINHATQTRDEYIGYKMIIDTVRCKDEWIKPIYK